MLDNNPLVVLDKAKTKSQRGAGQQSSGGAGQSQNQSSSSGQQSSGGAGQSQNQSSSTTVRCWTKPKPIF